MAYYRIILMEWQLIKTKIRINNNNKWKIILTKSYYKNFICNYNFQLN